MKMTIAVIIIGALALVFVGLLDGPLVTTSTIGTQTDVMSGLPGFESDQVQELASGDPDRVMRSLDDLAASPNVKVKISGVQRPHPNDCNPMTEVFVPGGGGKNVDLKKILSSLPGALGDLGDLDWGFCFDRRQHRAGAVTFAQALAMCDEMGKALPQPVHYQDACNTGVTDQLDTQSGAEEWAAVPSESDGSKFHFSTCDTNNRAGRNRLPFRCMR